MYAAAAQVSVAPPNDKGAAATMVASESVPCKSVPPPSARRHRAVQCSYSEGIFFRSMARNSPKHEANVEMLRAAGLGKQYLPQSSAAAACWRVRSC